MNHGFSYHVPPDPEQVPVVQPGRGRRVWFGILCLGTVYLSAGLVAQLDRQSLHAVLHPLAAVQNARPSAVFTIAVHAFVLPLLCQIILEWRYFTRPNRTRRRWANRSSVVLGGWTLLLGCCFLLALMAV